MKIKHDYCIHIFINAKLLTLNNGSIIRETVERVCTGTTCAKYGYWSCSISTTAGINLTGIAIHGMDVMKPAIVWDKAVMQQ